MGDGDDGVGAGVGRVEAEVGEHLAGLDGDALGDVLGAVLLVGGELGHAVSSVE